MLRELVRISCIACGRSLGHLERLQSALRFVPAAKLPTTAQLVPGGATSPHCGRCGGRAVIDRVDRLVSYEAMPIG